MTKLAAVTRRTVLLMRRSLVAVWGYVERLLCDVVVARATSVASSTDSLRIHM